METKVCNTCGKEKPITSFAVCFEGTEIAEKYGEKRQNRCKNCYAERYRLKLKYDFITAYGGKCTCCGEDDFRFLTLDHVNNDGSLHRETLQCQQIIAQARKQGFPQDKYTLLCFNCNSGRSCNKGICPHKTDKKLAWEDLLKKLEKNYTKRNTNFSNLPQAREALKQARIAKGYTGVPKTQAERSKQYRENTPGYYERKNAMRNIKKLTPDQAMKLIEMLSQKVVKQ